MNTKISSNIDPAPDPAGDQCTFCEGMGFIIPDVPQGDPRFGRAVPCICTANEQENQQLDHLLKKSQIGGLAHCTFDSFVVARKDLTSKSEINLKLAFDRIKAYAENPIGWLFLRGGYGAGKTHLAAAIVNYQLAKGRPALFINTPDLLDHLRSTYRPSSEISYDDLFEQVRTTTLLVLDDLGSQNNTEWAQEKLYQIFNSRYNAQLPTVITSNQEIHTLERRVQSRLVDGSLVQNILIAAPDFRRLNSIHPDQSDLSTLHLHRDKLFKQFDLRGEELPQTQAANLRRAYEVAQKYAADPKDWLIFNSISYGNGKTYLAAAIANELTARGEEVLFVVVPDLLDYLRAAFSPNSNMSLDRRFDEVKRAPILILDDLGTESATAWAREKMYQLFNYRYNARLPTIITSATAIDEIEPRLAARLLDGNRTQFFQLEVPSYRGPMSKKKSTGNSRRN